MDEYMFIVLAKLKADRLRLEREQREQQRAAVRLGRRVSRPKSSRAAASARGFAQFRWSKQS